MYFPVLTRFRTYGVELPPALAPYARALEGHAAVRALVELASTAPRIPSTTITCAGSGAIPTRPWRSADLPVAAGRP
jgi:hypothetical protein